MVVDLIYRCGHCKTLAPVYEQLADSLVHAKDKVVVAKVNADEHRELGQRFGVTGRNPYSQNYSPEFPFATLPNPFFESFSNPIQISLSETRIIQRHLSSHFPNFNFKSHTEIC